MLEYLENIRKSIWFVNENFILSKDPVVTFPDICPCCNNTCTKFIKCGREIIGMQLECIECPTNFGDDVIILSKSDSLYFMTDYFNFIWDKNDNSLKYYLFSHKEIKVPMFDFSFNKPGKIYEKFNKCLLLM